MHTLVEAMYRISSGYLFEEHCTWLREAKAQRAALAAQAALAASASMPAD